jgi:tetratricopeptide (TPR) repeat protein
MRAPLLLLLLAFCHIPAHAGDTTRNDWIEVRTPHFTILSNGSVRRAGAVGIQLECAQEFLGDDSNHMQNSPKTPLSVIAFRRWSELEEVAPYWNGKPVRLGGFYKEGEAGRFIAIDLSAQDTDHIVAHEFTHATAKLNHNELPVWLHEGLAEFFANTLSGKSPPTHREWIPLTSLFSIHSDSPEYNEMTSHTFYAQASLVAEYLWTNPDRRRLIDKYLQLTESNVPVDAAIEQAFQVSSKELNGAIETFAQNHRRDASAARFACTQIAVETHPISYVDARARVIELKSLFAEHRTEAIREFSTILRNNPKNKGALRGISYALWQSGDVQMAAEYFRRAAEAIPGDPKLYFYSAVLDVSRAEHDPEARRRMRESLLNAIALESDFADALHWLSLTYAWDGDYRAAVSSGSRAVELDPGNDEFKFNLAAFDAHAQRWDESRELCAHLRTAPNKDVASRAELLLKQIENEMRRLGVPGK